MTTYVAILAAGQGTRFGEDKTQVSLGGKPIWRWSYDAFVSMPEIAGVIIVGSQENIHDLRIEAPKAQVIVGGKSRQESSKLAVLNCPGDADALLIHDAARPFPSGRLIREVIQAISSQGAAGPALPVTDTIRRVTTTITETLPRAGLVAMQTPQGARIDLMRQAHQLAIGEATDDIALLEAAGIPCELVAGDPGNFKITTTEDLVRARAYVGGPETRTGMGYDIHPFDAKSTGALWLGGIEFPGHPALLGHSDADVLLHAIADAILGGACLGDIGLHFSNTDPQWRGARSETFVRQAVALAAKANWTLSHIDATVIAETPKIMARSSEMRQAIAEMSGLNLSRVSLKATTNEGLGSIGRGEGIAALAVATLKESNCF